MPGHSAKIARRSGIRISWPFIWAKSLDLVETASSDRYHGAIDIEQNFEPRSIRSITYGMADDSGIKILAVTYPFISAITFGLSPLSIVSHCDTLSFRQETHRGNLGATALVCHCHTKRRIEVNL